MMPLISNLSNTTPKGHSSLRIRHWPALAERVLFRCHPVISSDRVLCERCPLPGWEGLSKRHWWNVNAARRVDESVSIFGTSHLRYRLSFIMAALQKGRRLQYKPGNPPSTTTGLTPTYRGLFFPLLPLPGPAAGEIEVHLGAHDAASESYFCTEEPPRLIPNYPDGTSTGQGTGAIAPSPTPLAQVAETTKLLTNAEREHFPILQWSLASEEKGNEMK